MRSNEDAIFWDSLSDKRARETAAAMPLGLLVETAMARGFVNEGIGNENVMAVLKSESLRMELQREARLYANANMMVPVSRQLQFLRNFWLLFTGKEMPDMVPHARLSRELARTGCYRVVAAPLSSLAARNDLIKRVETQFPNLGTPILNHGLHFSGFYEYQAILQSQNGFTAVNGKPCGILYHAPNGSYLTRGAFIADMLTRRRAVKSDDGSIWIGVAADIRWPRPNPDSDYDESNLRKSKHRKWSLIYYSYFTPYVR